MSTSHLDRWSGRSRSNGYGLFQVRMRVNSPIRVVFSPLILDTWQPMYGLGRSPAQTTYHPWSSRNPTCLWFPFYIKNYIKPWNPTHIVFEIVFNSINKPFQVRNITSVLYPLYFICLTKMQFTLKKHCFQTWNIIKYRPSFISSDSIEMFWCDVAMQLITITHCTYPSRCEHSFVFVDSDAAMQLGPSIYVLDRWSLLTLLIPIVYSLRSPPIASLCHSQFSICRSDLDCWSARSNSSHAK